MEEEYHFIDDYQNECEDDDIQHVTMMTQLQLPDDVWYTVLRMAIGIDSHIRSATFQAATLMELSSVCKGAYRAGVSLAKELCAFVLVGDSSPLSYQPMLIVPRSLTTVHQHDVLKNQRMEQRITRELKLLLRMLKHQVVNEKDARRTYGLNTRDLDAITDDQLNAEMIMNSRLSQSPDAYCSMNVTMVAPTSSSATRVYLLANVQEASYQKFNCLEALNNHIARREQCEHRARQARNMKKRIKIRLEELMGARVYTAYAEGRFSATPLHETAKRAESVMLMTLANTTGNHMTCADDLSEDVIRDIQQACQVMESRMCKFDQCIASLHSFCKADVLKIELYNGSCRYASFGRERDLQHVRQVSRALDAVFADFIYESCLGVSDWGSIRALLCAPSMEGTLVEFARRSLEERHAIRMQLLTEIERWGYFDSTHEACSNDLVRDLLRLDSEHYMLNYDNPWFESEMEDALQELHESL